MENQGKARENKEKQRKIMKNRGKSRKIQENLGKSRKNIRYHVTQNHWQKQQILKFDLGCVEFVIDPSNAQKYIAWKSISLLNFYRLCFPGETDLKTILERFTRKISNKDGIFLWQCKSCNKLIKRKSHLIEHIESNHISGLQFKCPYCALFYKTRSSVRSHVHDKHKNDHLLYKMDMANLEWLIQDPVQNQMNVSY